MSDRIHKLGQLTKMVKDAELARLRELQESRHRVETLRAKLRQAQSDAYAAVAFDPAHLTGADLRWQGWASARLQDLSTELAQAAAEAETQKARARQAFGRDQALSKLAARLAQKKT